MEGNEDWKAAQFKFPIFEDELGEFERVSDLVKIPVIELLDAAEEGNMITLDEMLWSQLGNTDSYEIEKGDWERVDELSQQVGKEWKTLKEEIEFGKSVNAPIIMKHNGLYHLVSGNTRLMVCRALGIVPRVLVFEVE